MDNALSIVDRPLLDVWYVNDLTLCNFDCRYCASGLPERAGPHTRDRVWGRGDGEARFRRIVDWIAGQPFHIGLHMQTIVDYRGGVRH